MSHPYTTALIVAGGRGARMGADCPKQFLPVAGQPLLVHTFRAFLSATEVDAIVCIVPREYVTYTQDLLDSLAPSKPCFVTAGGETRQASVLCGMSVIPQETEYVAVHDGARCLITPEGIGAVLEEAYRNGAAIAASRISDTLKQFDGRGLLGTVDRDAMLSAETPQAFSVSLIRQAFQKAEQDGAQYTDDSAMVIAAGVEVMPVFLRQENRKITVPSDLDYADYILSKRESKEEQSKHMRIGHGYDVHRLVPDRPLVLGGVHISHPCGLLGHSDADVLTHAIMDALLGAAGLGDIGHLFPDTDPSYKGADSLLLLARVRELIAEQGYTVGNVDATVVAQAPKLAPYIPQMKERIAVALRISLSQINVKATTEEHLGFTGAGEGIASHAVCILHT